MVTARDVAMHAGVSVATVSRVLMGAPHVSPEKRQKVLDAVQALDYRPDQVARSLRTRRSNLIALVVSTIENQFFTEVARAAEQAAIRHGYNLVISNTDEKLEREQEYFSILSQQLVAGVILAPAPGDVASRRYLFEPAFPVVLINRFLQGAPCPTIVADDAEAAEACVNVLIGEGRRRIGCIMGIPEASTTQRRLRGYEAALQQAGLVSPPELRVSGNATFEGGFRAAMQLMSLSEPPDAIFVHNNVMTQGAVLALQDLGLRWPDDLDLAGFGAFMQARLYQPPLTLISQPTHAMGERAVDLLVDLLEHPRPQEAETIVLPCRVVSREEWRDAHQALRGEGTLQAT